jgi:L-2-hydroxyglutarate oxidase LhgO
MYDVAVIGAGVVGSAIAVPAELEELKELLEQNDILVEAVYEVSENKSGKKYRKIYSAK